MQDQLVDELYEAADAISVDEERDCMYQAIDGALQVFAPEALELAKARAGVHD